MASEKNMLSYLPSSIQRAITSQSNFPFPSIMSALCLSSWCSSYCARGARFAGHLGMNYTLLEEERNSLLYYVTYISIILLIEEQESQKSCDTRHVLLGLHWTHEVGNIY